MQNGKNGPPPASSANSKVGPFMPHTPVQKGDIVTSGGSGYWVCTRPHFTGSAFTLVRGQSDDNWHFSLGGS